MSNSGYLTIALWVEGRSLKRSVHQMVALAWIGANPGGLDVHHIDSEKTNNIPENLEYLTRKQNIRRAFDDGAITRHVSIRGSLHHNSILTEEQVVEIKTVLRDGLLSGARIARLCGVSPKVISNIRNNRAWTHVTLDESEDADDTP